MTAKQERAARPARAAKQERATRRAKHERPARTFGSFIYEMLLLAAGAFLYSLAFPSLWSDNGYPVFALFALIPVIYVIDRCPWSLVWLYGVIFGAGFYSLFNYWLSTFHPLAIYICGIAKGLELMLIFPFLKACGQSSRRWGYIFQALGYTASTFICQLGFLGYPYGQAGSALYSVIPAIQIADVTGIWGVSFLVLLPQSLVASWLVEQENPWAEPLGRRWIDLLAIAALWMANLCYGRADIAYYRSLEPERVVKVAAIQHNSDSWKGGYSQYKHNFEILTSLTEEALAQNPEMAVWSETAFVPSVAWHTRYPSHYATERLVEDFVSFGSGLRIPLVTGNPEGVLANPELPPSDESGNWNRTDYNSVMLFADGQIKGTYRKQHLVPFTEYFPYQNLMPSFTEFLRSHDFHWWEEGNESKVFEYDGISFSASICFEDTFSNISRDFVAAGSNLLLNLSNDSWSLAVPAEMQHMALGVFRSVENKRTTIRSTNSGITCMVTPWGEVINPLEPFTEAWAIYEAPIFTGETLYTRWGDWFAYVCLIASASAVLGCLFRRKPRMKRCTIAQDAQLFPLRRSGVHS